MTTKEILEKTSKNFSSLTEKELRSNITKLVSTANKRISRLKKSNVPSQALTNLSVEKFSIRGLKGKQLEGLFRELKNYLQAETSTVSGAKAVRKRTIKSLEKQGTKINENQYDSFFRIYEKLKERDSSISDKLFKYKVFEEISERLDKADFNTVLETMYNDLEDIYKETVGDYTNDTISRFFKLE